MADSNRKSGGVMVLHPFPALENSMILAGYDAMIAEFALSVPTPCQKPIDSLRGQLTVALKSEGIDLAVFKVLFESTKPQEVVNIVESEPTDAYSRRIWLCTNGFANLSWIWKIQLKALDITHY